MTSRLTFKQRIAKNKHYQWVSLYLCLCGKFTTKTENSVNRGNAKSCGCLRKDICRKNKKYYITHGKYKSAEYIAWQNMKTRCYNKNTKDYVNYGARGITVCDQWVNSPEKFLSDMGPKPEGCSLDRINNNGNYEPTNCRWATKCEQNSNRRNSKS